MLLRINPLRCRCPAQQHVSNWQALLFRSPTGLSKPAFVEAKEILESADAHLAQPWKTTTPEEYEHARRAALRPKVDSNSLDESVRSKPLKKFEEIIDAINEALGTQARPAHRDLSEPEKFPADYGHCLRRITGEKDRRRRTPILAAAGVPERGEDLVCIDAYWGLARKILPYLKDFGGRPPTRKRIGKRDKQGRIVKKISG
jgi:hypothetical protein